MCTLVSHLFQTGKLTFTDLIFFSVIGTPPQGDWPANVTLPRSSFSRYAPFSLSELIPEMCESGTHLLKVSIISVSKNH